MAAVVECTRHGFPHGRENAKPYPAPWYVHRCAHVGNAFIVDIRSARPGSRFIAIDYVVDEEWGRPKSIDAHEVMDEADADRIWDRLYRRLTTGRDEP